ncbi:MAG: MXAN_5187 C-terminal domain-containing protein [Candidatus Acidiferrales bacterium]
MATVDEDLSQIEKDIRTLKIEFEQFFAGGRKRPPTDTQWRVESLIRRYGERLAEIKYAQRFRYNNLASTYAKYQEVWRKKLQQKETGTQQHHFGAAAKAIEAERARLQEKVAQASAPSVTVAPLENPVPSATHSHDTAHVHSPQPESGPPARPGAFAMQFSDPAHEKAKLKELYAILLETRLATGEKAGTPSFQDFERFVQKKTNELKEKGGKEVEYTVSVEGGKVRLKARVSK